VTDRPVLDVTEERLRRMFERRAEDMAPGDGVEWDPHQVTAVVVPAPLAPRVTRRAHRRVLVAAIAAVAVPAMVVAALALRGDGGDDTAERPTPPTPDADAPTTTATPPSPPPAPEGEGASPSTTPSTLPACPPVTAPPGVDPTETPRVDDDPNNRTLAHFVGRTEQPDGRSANVHIQQFTAPDEFTPYPGEEPIMAGDNPGMYLEMEGSDGYVTAIRMVFGELGVVVEGGGVTREQLVAVAASVRLGADGRIEYTPPAGFDAVDVC
jgi:hypothetical protein